MVAAKKKVDDTSLSHYLPVTLSMFINVQFVQRIKGPFEDEAIDSTNEK